MPMELWPEYTAHHLQPGTASQFLPFPFFVKFEYDGIENTLQGILVKL